jgi:hypothetical protein
MKKTENAQADALSKKPGYKEKQKPEDSFIFRRNRNNLILNKRQLVFIIYVKRDLFINQIKVVYKDNIIAE